MVMTVKSNRGGKSCRANASFIRRLRLAVLRPEANIHARRIVLYWRIVRLFAFGEGNDLVELFSYFHAPLYGGRDRQSENEPLASAGHWKPHHSGSAAAGTGTGSLIFTRNTVDFFAAKILLWCSRGHQFVLSIHRDAAVSSMILDPSSSTFGMSDYECKPTRFLLAETSPRLPCK
jgi:hypothetical protein